MEQLALSERTLRSGVAAGGRHRPAGLHSPGLLEERYMHVEGPLDRIGTLSAFIWLVKTIDDAATTSSWTHACHVAGRRMHVAAGRRAGDGGQGTPSYSPAHPRHQQAATAGGVRACRARPAAATIDDRARTRCADHGDDDRPTAPIHNVRARTAGTLYAWPPARAPLAWYTPTGHGQY